MFKNRNLLVFLAVLVVLAGFSFQGGMEVYGGDLLKGWAIFEGTKTSLTHYQPEEGEIIYLIEAQIKNISSEIYPLNFGAFQLKDDNGFLHPCRNAWVSPIGGTMYWNFEPGIVIWNTWAFSAPKDINPKEIIVGPGAFSNKKSVRFAVQDKKPVTLLVQDTNMATPNRDVVIDKIKISLDSYSIEGEVLKVALNYQNMSNEDIEFSSPVYLVGNQGKLSDHSLFEDMNKFPPTFVSSERIKARYNFPLKGLNPPFFLSIREGALMEDVEQYFWKIEE